MQSVEKAPPFPTGKEALMFMVSLKSLRSIGSLRSLKSLMPL